MRRILSPLLSVPHVAVAIGLVFAIAPSGLVFRLLSSFVVGFRQPPDVLIIHDSLGLALIAGLVVKEVPFLFLMCLAALPQTGHRQSLAAAASLGYAPATAWLKTVLPRLYPQLRLPVLAVLAYSISVVDVAIVLGPTTPPTLPVMVLKWMNDPVLGMRFLASAGAILILVVTLAAVLAWLGWRASVGTSRPGMDRARFEAGGNAAGRCGGERIGRRSAGASISDFGKPRVVGIRRKLAFSGSRCRKASPSPSGSDTGANSPVPSPTR